MRKAYLFLLVCGVLWFSGCAFMPERVRIDYIPATDTKAIAGAEKIDVSVQASDSRTVKDRIGSKRNGYGMECAGFIAENDLTTMIKDALKKELKNRGFGVEGDKVSLRVELTRLYNDFKMGFWAGSAVGEVGMSVQVKKKDGTILFTRTVGGTSTITGLQLCRAAHVKNAIEGALKDAMNQLFNDSEFIAALLQAGK